MSSLEVRERGRAWALPSSAWVALLAGTVAAAWSGVPWTAVRIAGCAALALIVAVAAVRTPALAPVRRNALMAVAFGMAGAAWTAGHALAVLRAQWPAAWEGREIEVRGQVLDLPVVDARRTRFLLRVDEAQAAPSLLRGRLLQLAWYDDFDALAPGPRRALRAGAHWRLWVRLRAPRGLRNPGGADAERHAAALRLVATGQVRRPAEADELRAPHGVDAWRDRMSGRIVAAVAGPGARFIQALALGDTRGLAAADWQTLRATGLTHLIAISGFHVGLVALGAAWCLRAVWWAWPALPRRWPRDSAAAWAAMLAAAAYAGIAGGSLPTWRTVWMVAVVCLARLARRRVSALHALGLALLVAVVVDPLSPLLPGFWLSFGGVACLAALMPAGSHRVPMLLTFLRAQWVATVCLLPVSIAWFAEASWVGPLVNLLAIPWWSLVVVPLALSGLAMEAVHTGAGGLAWRAAEACFTASWRIFSHAGSWPFARAGWPQAPPVAAVLALLGAIWWLMPRGVPGKALAVTLWLGLAWPETRRPRAGEVELAVLDVGQGLAVLVRTRDHALLYDAGPRVEEGYDAGERVVLPALRALGVRRLDALVVSHGDGDHAGGAAAVLAAGAVEARYTPPGMPWPGTRAPCARGGQWQWDGVAFRFLHPPPGFPYLANESSCVLRVQAGNRVALLTGDIGQVVKQRLLRLDAADLRADLVVAPHHGSAGSSSHRFIGATAARLVIFAAGHGNRFGHPRPGVVRAWARAGAETLETARSGAIRVWLGRDGLAVREQRRWQPRWWDAEVRLRATAILSPSKQAADRAGGSERVGTGQGGRLAHGAPAAAGDPGAGYRARTPVDAAPQ
ncbi:DNA internalization-related competence protein ComEC/Rec2 [Stenotrophomonas sp. HITSZ_GD]|uniref:DNA internalization-related competence protein ComEC/Rec2 n=1 Tax=Stenotrophomonas sp. HITSZ_GD TaxID=3037248 RepID=UPI00240DBC82|nr:DNA internalization-related competence protein ComEC/Rec2 [Stenotrophomonas sp. HITSZ_GD]MDG2524377.1 DNA internalization-related competence protein ComEC/Rec2 [Stenotrophomonas sp. HITSZ_GD]